MPPPNFPIFSTTSMSRPTSHDHRAVKASSLRSVRLGFGTLLATSLLLTHKSAACEAWRPLASTDRRKGVRSRKIHHAPSKNLQKEHPPVLPAPLQHHTRGGYTSPSSRSPLHRLSRLFSTSTLAPPPPSTRPNQRQGWQQNRVREQYPETFPPPPIEYESPGRIDGDLILPSSYKEDLKRQVVVSNALDQGVDEHLTSSRDLGLTKTDLALFGTYFCNSVAVTLPVILMPMVAAEHIAGLPSHANTLSAAGVVAAIASISTLGGGFGKLFNGFVCQAIGGQRSSSLYLVALSLSSFLLSVSPASRAGWILALNEFCASIQWTACSLVLANHYDQSPAKFAKGITILSLASTSGMMVSKLGGTALVNLLPSWRNVAQAGSLMALLGAGIVKFVVSEHPTDRVASKQQKSKSPQKRGKQHQSIGESIKAVLGNPLFWQVGIAHATAMLARTSDRILGAFFHQTTELPRSLCGGLTVFLTLGFVHGVCKGRAFHKLEDIPSKTTMLAKAYRISALSALCLALCSNNMVQRIFFQSQNVLAATLAVITAVLSSNLSFQFFQIPAMVATAFFDRNKALCLSLFDAMGFFVSAQVWAATGKIVNSAGQYGWSLSWLMLAAMFAAGGKTMMSILPSVLHKQQQRLARG